MPLGASKQQRRSPGQGRDAMGWKMPPARTFLSPLGAGTPHAPAAAAAALPSPTWPAEQILLSCLGYI